MFGNIKSLAGKSLIYGGGNFLLKGITFLLIPLYTRHLTPADYGIMSVAMTLTTILGIVYPLSLHGAFPRFYFNVQNDDERRIVSGTIGLAILLIAGSITILLNLVGVSLFSLVFREVPFDPYIRLVTWIAFFNVVNLLPLLMVQMNEKPALYVAVNVFKTLLSIGSIVLFVVVQQKGIVGYLQGMLIGAVASSLVCSLILVRNAYISLRWAIFKAALLYSLPLIPHTLSNWILNLSDRIILERYVSLDQLGLYGLGCQFGSIMTMIATAINQAWVPFLYKTEAAQGDNAKPELARLSTYFVLVLCWIAISLLLLMKDVIFIMTVPAFHAAQKVTPWIIGGLLLQGLYFIPVNFLFLKSHTGIIPVITFASGLINIGLNLWLIPKYGIIAAAQTTLIAYAIMLLLVWLAALHYYPIPYEYERLGKIAAGTGFLFAGGVIIQFDSLALDIVVKLVMVGMFPVILAAFGFFTDNEKVFIRSLVTRKLHMVI